VLQRYTIKPVKAGTGIKIFLVPRIYSEKQLNLPWRNHQHPTKGRNATY
jgi:hypothetical protein